VPSNPFRIGRRTSSVLMTWPAWVGTQALVACASGQTPPVPQVVTSAMAETRVTPDRATIFIGVQTRGSTAAQAGADNARRQRAVLDTLRALGIPSQDLATIEYNVSPEQRFNPQGGDTAPKIVGYTVSNTVRVEVAKIDQIGKLIDAALAKGANGVNSLQFSASNIDSARHAALSQAVARAHADAETIAASTNSKVGELLEISTQRESPTPIYAAARMSAVAGTTPINPGQESVSVAIVARWRLISGTK